MTLYGAAAELAPFKSSRGLTKVLFGDSPKVSLPYEYFGYVGGGSDSCILTEHGYRLLFVNNQNFSAAIKAPQEAYVNSSN